MDDNKTFTLLGDKFAAASIDFSRPMRVAFITYDGSVKYSAANGFDEIQDLLPFLQSKGLDIHEEIWDDPAVDWTAYQVALLRMPWDYHQKFEEFKAWLTKIESLGITLLNNYETVRWNIDKHYLQQITNAGCQVIPSIFLEQGWNDGLPLLFDALSSDQIILKPCVSGGSRDTLKVSRTAFQEAQAVLAELLTQGAYIAQPFMKEINDGEWSFTFFNGTYSHTILKKPKAGDFRVQQFFGGTIERIDPQQEHIDQAASFVSAFAPETLYARVDGLMVDNNFMLMELELVEPFLYLAYHPEALGNFYRALTEKINELAEAEIA
ncbi:RimK family alpha-L-glutamate ligase [Larkinella insperata]|uniref:RimK family alpha-L-glutamate ligase n=1 Tax=Larkinella insperata TaxID=332158 RepID=A0ABW3QKM6_9BACT